MTTQQRKRPGGGKPPKSATELGQIRAGTTRHKILTMMSDSNVSHTLEDMANAVGVTATRVAQHAYCLWRDLGVGYRLRPDHTLIALYPPGKSLTDAVKHAP
jgi:hypothetical protein